MQHFQLLKGSPIHNMVLNAAWEFIVRQTVLLWVIWYKNINLFNEFVTEFRNTKFAPTEILFILPW